MKRCNICGIIVKHVKYVALFPLGTKYSNICKKCHKKYRIGKKLNKVKRCNCWTNKDKRCNKPLFVILRVQVYHPNSMRKSWQTWYLCRDCYAKFRETNGKEWGCKYRNNKKPFAPLIQYKII